MASMSRNIIFYYTLLSTLLPLCLFSQNLDWHKQKSPIQAGLRALHIVNDSVVWTSGTRGTILLTTNGGQQWQAITPPDSLDFRSLWAFNEKEAIIASAGQPAKVFRTADGGKQWQLVYEDATGKAFFDAINFWNDGKGLLLSDPVEGRILMFMTTDRGQHWKRVQMPPPAVGEAFFAASNGSIAVVGTDKAWVGTGGKFTRVLATDNGGKTWTAQKVPMPRLSDATGIYALTFIDENTGVAVGGAYDVPKEGDFAAYYTTNGGKTWHVAQQPPKGYRSGVAAIPGKPTFLAVGTTGTDISTDGGYSWNKVNGESLNSIRISPSGKWGWAVGPDGAIYKFKAIP